MSEQLEKDMVAKLLEDYRRSSRMVASYMPDASSASSVMLRATAALFTMTMGSAMAQLTEEGNDALILKLCGDLYQDIIAERNRVRKHLADPQVREQILRDAEALFGRNASG